MGHNNVLLGSIQIRYLYLYFTQKFLISRKGNLKNQYIFFKNILRTLGICNCVPEKSNYDTGSVFDFTAFWSSKSYLSFCFL